jgi:metal-responsive CopG/Arc/MetJ family transcriptional regulator
VPHKKLIAFDDETLTAVDAFTADQGDKPNRSEAIRRLLRDALISLGYLKNS